jgi:hypothetical protein
MFDASKVEIMSAYTKIICPCNTRQAQNYKYSPDSLTPPSGGYSPLLSLGTGISSLEVGFGQAV